MVVVRGLSSGSFVFSLDDATEISYEGNSYVSDFVTRFFFNYTLSNDARLTAFFKVVYVVGM